MTEEITLHGTITSIKFRNPDGWAVFMLDSSEKKVNILTDVLVSECTGTLSDIIDINSDVECRGKIVQSKYGPQLKCSAVIPAPIKVDSASGVIRILQRLPGIGPAKAAQAVKEHGHELAWRIAQECPSALGISNYLIALKAQEQAKKLAESTAHEATIYFLSIGLTDHQIRKIVELYGSDDAVKVVSENPYRLIDDVDGFAFKLTDSIALKAGIKINNQARINACVMYCLLDSEQNGGNIYLNGKYLIKLALDNLESSAMKMNMPMVDAPGYSEVRQSIAMLEKEGRVVVDGLRVYSVALLGAEKVILRNL